MSRSFKEVAAHLTVETQGDREKVYSRDVRLKTDIQAFIKILLQKCHKLFGQAANTIRCTSLVDI